MILASLAVLAAPILTPGVFEVVDPASETIVLHAIAVLPELGEKELAAARVLAEVLPKGTEDYSASSIQRYSSMSGSRARCFLYSDSLHVRVIVPKGQLPLGVSLLDSLVRRASLPEDAIKLAAEKQPFRFRSYWLEALDPWGANYARLTRNDVLAIYKAAFRPEKLFIGVGGAFDPGGAKAAFDTRWEAWKEPLARPLRPSRLTRPMESRKAGISTLDIVAPVVVAKDPDFYARLLAVFALGSGKGSSAFRIAREGEGLAYRVESLLWPHPSGWQPRLVLAFDAKRSTDGLGERLLASLSKDVESWDFETKERAVGIAESALTLGFELNPFYFRGEGTVGQGLEDRAFLAAYWPMKTGAPWDAERLLASLRAVEVDMLRTAATTMLKDTFVRVITGSK